jgi:predicted MPP superfamily phosphohydrolase
MGRIRRLIIYSDKITKSKKILTYSDLHLGFKDRSNIKEVFTIPELSPNLYDYILIPGDIVHSGKILEDTAMKQRVLDILTTLTGNTRTFISLGNHDQYERFGFENWAEYCANSALSTYNQLPNTTILDINKEIVEDGIEFSAINNSVHYFLENREKKEFFEQEYNLRDPKMSFSKDCFSILLTHDPKSIYRLSKEKQESFVPNTDLVVSGHMHNGLTPNFMQGIMHGKGILSPDYTFFPEIAYGVQKVGDTLFLVNGAISSFVEFPLVSKIYGVNCTIIELHPKEEIRQKKLTYKYK